MYQDLFDSAVSGHANNGEIAQDTDRFDLFKLCEDLFLTKNERTSMFREGIQSDDLSKISCSAEDRKK